MVSNNEKPKKLSDKLWQRYYDALPGAPAVNGFHIDAICALEDRLEAAERRAEEAEAECASWKASTLGYRATQDADVLAARIAENERLRQAFDSLNDPAIGGLGCETRSEDNSRYWEGRREILAILHDAVAGKKEGV